MHATTGFIYANGIFPSVAWNRTVKGFAQRVFLVPVMLQGSRPAKVFCDYGNNNFGPLPASEADQQAMLRPAATEPATCSHMWEPARPTPIIVANHVSYLDVPRTRAKRWGDVKLLFPSPDAESRFGLEARLDAVACRGGP